MLRPCKIFCGQVMNLNKKIVAVTGVLSNERLGGDVYCMVVSAPEICREAKPGQFVHIKTGWADSPLLRRPLSVADVQEERLTVIYRAIGTGTGWLAERQRGETVDMVGPLGHGFSLSAQKPLLAGGGLGIAPLLYLARAFAAQGTVAALLLADRTAKEISYWQSMFDRLYQDIYITTDDGSAGVHGNALAVLPKAAENRDCIYACGPVPMLKAITKFVEQANIPCQVSLESHMACGLGACQACSCPTAAGVRRRICLNGPVFAAGEVVL